ncbi:MAG: protein kinase [Gammaproteobacteria bacterium]|nr:protein kinase [Gammaproteobacteria bacterium]
MGRYVLEKLIGQGGMGVVYKARDTLQEQAMARDPYVAVKVLTEEFKQHPDSLKALHREARKAQDLGHENIVSVFSFERDGTNIFMVMELLDGEPLDELIKRLKMTGGLPWSEAKPIIRGMSLALDYAHNKGIVHSDFKPGNCYLTKAGIVKVFDFGIARAAKTTGDEEGVKTLFDASTLGALTPAYASCEMLDDDEDTDPDARDDIYALACVSYELLTGKHPFNKKKATVARAKNLVPARPPGIKRYQYKALLHGLAFNREDRVPSAVQFLNEIAPKRQNSRVAILSVIAVVVLIAVLAVVVVPTIMLNWTLERIAGNLQSSQVSEVDQGVAEALALDSGDRAELFKDYEIEDPLVDHFQRKATTLFAPESGQYDYPAAREQVDQLLTLMPRDSAAAALQTDIEAARNDYVVNLTERFNQFLTEGKLLPVEGEDDMQDVLAQLQQIDPTHPLLSDDRLTQAYAELAEAALPENPADNRAAVDRADALVLLGEAYAADDAILADLRDRIDGLRESLTKLDRIDEIESGVVAGLAGLAAVEDVNAIKPAMNDLATIAADSSVLAQAREAAAPVIGAALQEMIEARRYDDARSLANEYDTALGDDWTQAQQQQIDAGQQAFERRIGQLQQQLAQNIDGNDLAAAVATVEQLATAGANPAMVADSRDQVARAWLDRARAARQQQQWDTARINAEQGLALEPSGALTADLRTEIQAANDGETISEAEAAGLAIAQYAADFEQGLQAGDLNVGTLLATLATLDRAATDAGQTHPLQSEGLNRIVEAVSARALQQETQDNLTGAIATVDRAIAALAGNDTQIAALQQTRTDLANALAERRALAEQAETERVQGQIGDLLASGRYPQSTHDQITALIGQLPADVAPSERAKTAAAYVNRAKELREQNRFSDIDSLLDRAAELDPQLAGIEDERLAARTAQQTFEQEQAERRRVGRIEGLKTAFRGYIVAGKTNEAEEELRKLRRELGDDDAFVVGEAATSLADAFKRNALSQAQRQRFADALRQVEQGLSYQPGRADLEALRSEYRLDGFKEQVQSAVSSGSATQIRNLASQAIPHIRSNASNYGEFEQQTARSLVSRIERVKDANLSQATQLKSAGLALFPGNQAIGRVDLTPVAVEPPPDLTIGIRQAFRAGTAEDIRSTQASLRSVQSNQPVEYATLVSELESTLKTRSEGLRSSNSAGCNALKAAGLSVLPANAVFSGISCTVAPVGPSAGRPCESRLAGLGGRGARARCWDHLPSADESGPSLVVVGNAAFAIMPYEASIGDFNTYCSSSGRCPTRPGNAKLPVTGVSIADVQAYADWLSRETGKTYRLPTASEWRYAAAADGGQPDTFGFNCKVMQGGSQVKGFSLEAVDFGSRNDWGLYNYVGNVHEWVDGGSAVRGGAWTDDGTDCTVDFSRPHGGQADDVTGFRLIREM